MASAVARLPKPNFANVQRRHLYKHIYYSIALGMSGSIYSYFFWYRPKWQKVEEYERNYDPFSEMERMRQLGLFSSCPPDWVLEERKQKKLAKNKK